MNNNARELLDVRLSGKDRKEKTLEYIELMSLVQELQENSTTGLESTRRVAQVMGETRKLAHEVHDPQIISLDAKVISVSSDVLKRNVESIDVNAETFKPEEFCEAILGHVGDAELQQRDSSFSVGKDSGFSVGKNWRLLLEFVNKAFKVSHTPFFMCNNIDLNEPISPSQQRVRRSPVIESEAQVKKPEKVKTVEKEEDGIEESVEHIMGIIISEWRKNGKKPLCFFSLVVNPNSFTMTVENIFHLSFLIRDDMVDFITDRYGNPSIVPHIGDEAQKSNAGRKERSQMIMSISMDQWKEIKHLYNIRRPMITPLLR